MQLPLLQTISELSTRWKSILDPFLADPFVNGQILTGIVLINGVTVINHKLNRLQQGWVLVDQNAAANIFRSQSFNSSTLTLTSDALVTVNLWVF